MAKEKRARYRRHRDDVYTHPKTGRMSMAAYTLMNYACAQNILGVLQKSPRAIAAAFAKTTARDVQLTLDELLGRDGLARWWPDIETLWIVEALDEQSDGVSADKSAAKLLVTMPPEVRDAIVGRYGDRLTMWVKATVPDRVSMGLFDRANPQEKEAGDRKQEQETGAADARLVVERVAYHRARLQLPALPPSELDDRHIRARLAAGVTLEDLLLGADCRAEAAEQDPNEAGALNCRTPFTGPNPNGKGGGWSWTRGLVDRARRRGAMPRTGEPSADFQRRVELERRRQHRAEGEV